MKISEAIARADELCPNAIPEKIKAQWVQDLDGQLAETMGIVPPVPAAWPDSNSADLLMPWPHEEVYQLYLVARIDYYNKDLEAYANDMTVFQAAFDEARAWWRRHHRGRCDGNWRTM